MKCFAWVLVVSTLTYLAALARAEDQAKHEPIKPPAGATLIETVSPPVEGNDWFGNGHDDGHCDRGGFFATAGILWIQPNFESNPAFRTTTTTPTGSSTTVTDFSWKMEVAPQVELGWISRSGLGVRGRWWYFDANATETLRGPSAGTINSPSPLGLALTLFIFSPNPSDVITVTSDLNLNVWDLEASYEISPDRWNILLAGGVRYAHMAQNYNFLANLNQGTLIRFVESSHNFNGAGPTLAVDARRRFGESGFALYGKGRGSLLFGTAKEQAFFGSPGGFLVSVERSQADTLPVLEFEVGAEYGRDFGRSRVFVQAGLVGQSWFGAGNAANVTNTGRDPDNTSNLGFIGLAVRAGVNF